MSRRDVRAFLWDVINSAHLIAEFTNGAGEEDYASDLFAQAAVERHLIIVGEAVRSLEQVAPELAAALGVDIRGVIGLRNILVHGYDGVDPYETFTIIRSDLPVLSEAAQIEFERFA